MDLELEVNTICEEFPLPTMGFVDSNYFLLSLLDLLFSDATDLQLVNDYIVESAI